MERFKHICIQQVVFSVVQLKPSNIPFRNPDTVWFPIGGLELDPDYGKAKIIGDMIKEKKLGSKTGQGFYQWENGRICSFLQSPS